MSLFFLLATLVARPHMESVPVNPTRLEPSQPLSLVFGGWSWSQSYLDVVVSAAPILRAIVTHLQLCQGPRTCNIISVSTSVFRTAHHRAARTTRIPDTRIFAAFNLSSRYFIIVSTSTVEQGQSSRELCMLPPLHWTFSSEADMGH